MLIGLLIALLASVLPALVWVLFFYWADRYEREPGWLVLVTFIWGAIPAIIVSLIAEIAVGAPFVQVPGSLTENLVTGSIVAPIVEELAKGMALLGIFYWRRQEFDGVLDGLVYGALVGFGFAMTENFLYFVGALSEGGIGAMSVLIFLRAILFGLNHAFYTGLFGIGLGLARNQTNPGTRATLAVTGLIVAILAHALHNLGASLVEVNVASLLISLMVAGAAVGLTLLAIGLSWQHERKVLLAELTPEVGNLLSADELTQLTERWRQPVRKGKSNPRQRRHLLVEYANHQRRLRRRGLQHEPELARELEQLRQRLTAAA